MPRFNPTAPPLPLEQHFYGLPAPPRSAADTTAHSLGAAASSRSTPAANMVADLAKTTNVAASVVPCIVGWDFMKPQDFPVQRRSAGISFALLQWGFGEHKWLVLFQLKASNHGDRATDWAAWSTAFLDRFPENHQIDIKCKQLVAHCQLPGESVSTFAADVRWLAKRAFPNWNRTGENDRRATAEPFYQCGMSRGGRAIAVPKTMLCKPSPLIAAEKKEVNISIWLTNGHLNQIPATRCIIRNQTVCTNTGFFGSRGLVLDTTEQQAVSPSLCHQVWDDKEYRCQPLVMVQAGVWVTQKILQVEYEWCCKDTCRSAINFLAEVGTIATIDKEDTISDLGDLGGCPPLSGRYTDLQAAHQVEEKSDNSDPDSDSSSNSSSQIMTPRVPKIASIVIKPSSHRTVTSADVGNASPALNNLVAPINNIKATSCNAAAEIPS
uniref:Retrotransposon gag domain-containing protein n=1 Tax=Romanomermis culicivorax TaxID=13658 RepID=A0A915I4G5_ROMCU